MIVKSILQRKRPRSLYPYFNMAPRLSGQTSKFGVVSFVSMSLLGIERQKKLKQFAILTRKPRSQLEYCCVERGLLAEALNNYFINIGPSLAHEMAHSSVSFESFVKPSHSESSEFRTVTNANVQKTLEGRLSPAKATGIDNISGKILKVAALAISSSLRYIFNHAFISCCFADDWKVARVLPLHKKGPRNLPDNYRPISILPAISKITERILYNQLHNYLSANDILCERQFVVRRLHSTASVLLDSTNSWYLYVDRKMFNLAPFLDLKKAFDTVNHEILLRKMEIYGVTGNALNLMKSYLTGRKQIRQLNGVSSTENRIGCGIPQGSILGPLFFLLYK